MIVRTILALALIGFSSASMPGGVQTGTPSPVSSSCQPEPPALSRVLEISDRVILAKVTRVTRDATPKQSAGEPRLERGVFELTPVKALKGDLPVRPQVHRYDATLYPDLFGDPPCRWSPLPVEGEVWLIVASRDGEDCAECDGRLDATHKLYYLAPAGWFRP